MKGIILHWDDKSNKGLVRGADELKYEFSSDDFKSQNKKIKAGIEIDFDKDGNVARNIYVIQSSTVCDIKDAVQETAVKTGTKLFKFLKVFVPLIVVVIALIAGGNHLLEEHKINKALNKEFNEYQLAKQKADEYFANKQYSEALVIYNDLPLRFYSSARFGKMSQEVDISSMQCYKELEMFDKCYEIFARYNESNLLQQATSDKGSAEILRLKDECIDLNITLNKKLYDDALQNIKHLQNMYRWLV